MAASRGQHQSVRHAGPQGRVSVRSGEDREIIAESFLPCQSNPNPVSGTLSVGEALF